MVEKAENVEGMRRHRVQHVGERRGRQHVQTANCRQAGAATVRNLSSAEGQRVP